MLDLSGVRRADFLQTLKGGKVRTGFSTMRPELILWGSEGLIFADPELIFSGSDGLIFADPERWRGPDGFFYHASGVDLLGV